MAAYNNGVSGNSSVSENSATTKGTRIVKPGSELDKNAFLRILSAELTNQDPMNTKDSTQYVSQMAQFASMEQMSNLNTTMTGYTANSLIGRGVVTNVNDINGVPYTGIVRDVTNNSGKIKIGVEVGKGDTTEILEFDYTEVKSVIEVPNTSMDNLMGNTALLAAANLIGKKAEFDIKDESGNNLTGLVKGIVKDSGLLKLRVQKEGSDEISTVTLDTLLKIDMA
jgi:flagellar basal-body rod modification protein FlgD